MLPINTSDMAQIPESIPESISEVKEYCANCGRVLGSGARFVKATIEQVEREGERAIVDCDARHFCEECAKKGLYVTIASPQVLDDGD